MKIGHVLFDSYVYLPWNFSHLAYVNTCWQMYSTVCRVATVFQTRYTAPGFWCAGLNLFLGMEKLVTNPSEKDHLKTCIARARDNLDEKENEESMPSNRQPGISSKL
jgi:hypothetical protein